MYLTALKYLFAAGKGLKAIFVAHWRVIAVVVVCWYGWHLYNVQYDRAEQAVADLAEYKRVTDAAAVASHFQNLALEKAGTENNIKTALAYNSAHMRLKDYYAKNPTIVTRTVGFGVRLEPSCGSVSAAETDSAPSGANDPAEGLGAGAAEVTALDCAEDVLQLLTLQKWEREQGALFEQAGGVR
jgi:hypothetical protein